MKYLTLIITFLLGSNLAGKSDPRQPQQDKPDSRQFESGKPDSRQFPRHWGRPPEIQTRDMVKLPGKFGMGSSTLASWIRGNLQKDAEKKRPGDKKPESNKPKPKPPVKPVPPIVPLPPVEIKEKMDVYKETQRELQGGLRSALEALGKKPSREEVRKTIEKFRAENKDAIEVQKELGNAIQDWHKENRPERVKRPEPPEAIKEQAQKVRETKKALDEVKGTFHEALKRSKDLTKEERENLVREFKEANADKHKALKEAQKELQKQIREIKQQGDRRQ